MRGLELRRRSRSIEEISEIVVSAEAAVQKSFVDCHLQGVLEQDRGLLPWRPCQASRISFRVERVRQLLGKAEPLGEGE